MLKLTSLKNLILAYNLKEVLKRFLLSVFCALAITVLVLGQVFKMIDTSQDPTRVIILLTSAFFGFAALRLYAESVRLPLINYRLWSLSLLAVIAYIFFCEGGYEFLSYTVGLALLMAVAPFFKEETEDMVCCNFAAALVNSAFFALATATILAIGICAILATIDYLFEVKITQEFYKTTLAVCYCFVAPLYLLEGVPADFNLREEDKCPKGVKFITTFILVPLALAYIVILYAYMVKILTQGKLPKGILAYIISGFGIAGSVIHFLAYPLAQKGNIFLRLFCKYFYHLLLVPTGLLFWAVILRIREYGITEDRYLLLLLAIGLALSSLYVVLASKAKLRVVPMIISGLLIFSSVGSWSASSVSKISQVKRLEVLLKRNNILQEGKIVKLNGKIALGDNQNIGEIINYLIETGKIKAIKKWLPGDVAIDLLSDAQSSKIMDFMGLDYAIKRRGKSFGAQIFKMNNAPGAVSSIQKIQGFDYMISFSFYRYSKTPYFLKDESGKVLFIVSFKDNILTITNGSAANIALNLNEFIDKLKYSKKKDEDFIINYQDKAFQARLYITTIETSGFSAKKIADYTNYEIGRISGMALLKVIN